MLRLRMGLALSLPVAALVLQWLLWAWITPFVWFLFFPAVFCSAQFGGRLAGLASTLLSAALVYLFFLPRVTAHTDAASGLYSIALFVVMGLLFSDAAERLRRSRARADDALAEARTANVKISGLFRKTLELDELKTRFFASVSDELRTPLTLIMSPLARRLAAPGPAGAQRAEDEMMMRNAQQLYRHVSDLLVAAKLESGHMACDYARLDLSRLVRGITAQFNPMAGDKRIDYRVDVPPSLEAEVDAEKVERIVLNLLSNAFKFTPEGGNIAVRLRQDANEIALEVEDSGPGVPADLREAVFDRFHQLGGVAPRRFAGIGLGLVIVKEFSELHGGRARATEAPDGGALFSVRLPLRAPAGTALNATRGELDPVIRQEAVDAARMPIRNTMRSDIAPAPADAPLVLVIEDNADMSAFVTDTLRPYCRVASAVDGHEGVAQALALQPDLILCDMMMPGLAGDQVVPELRRHATMAEVPIVMLTANPDDDLRVRLLENGVQGYLTKPFAAEELVARVLWVINERKRAQGELRRYEQIVATSGDMLLFVDTAHRFVVTNPAYARMYDSTPAALRQRDVATVVGPATYARIGPLLDRALAGEPQHFVASVIFPDGRPHVLDAEYLPFPPEGPKQGVVISLRDITELKESADALRASEERLRLAFDASQEGLWDWDLRTDRAFLTPRFYEIAGYRAGEVSPGSALFRKSVHAEDRARVEASIGANLKGKTAVSEFEFRLVRGNGDVCWVTGRGRVVERNAAGRALRMIGTLNDISHRKSAEEALQQHAEELAQRNAELERFNRASVGRELDMIALKREINRLSRELGLEPPYARLAGEAADRPAVDGPA